MRELGCTDGYGRRGCKGVAGNGWGEEAAGDQRAWLRGGVWTAWVKGVGGNGWGKKPLGMLGCADGCGRRGCKGVAGNLAARTAADGVGARESVEMDGEKKPLGMSELAARTAADGVVARECLEMCGEQKPLGINELGCADGCGRRGCKGVAGNGRGEEAAGDERAWLRGRLRTAWVQGFGWKWVGRRSRWE